MTRPICIIDDDEDVRSVMTFALEFEGMTTLPFASALQAEEYLSRLPQDELPCLIIVDYMMPEMDGVEFINVLHTDYPDTLARLPIALSTARLSDETEELPYPVMRLEKPLDLNHFLQLAKAHYWPSEKSFSF